MNNLKRKMQLFVLSLFAVGGIEGATVTYDFKQIATDKVSSNSSTVLKNEPDADGHANRHYWDSNIGIYNSWFENGDGYTNTFDNRFACATGKYSLRSNGVYTGLWNQGDYHNLFTILNLRVGEKVKITWRDNAEKLTYDATYSTEGIFDVSDDSELTNGAYYEIKANGKLSLRPTTAIHIYSIEIDGPTVPVLLGVLPEVYDFTTINHAGMTPHDANSRYCIFTVGDNVADDMNMVSFNGNDFGGRFSAGPRAQNVTENYNCFKVRITTDGWGGLYSEYSGRYWGIRNLQIGDKVTIAMKSDRANLKFKNAMLEGVNAGDAVGNGSEYTVTAAGVLILETTNECIIQKIIISPTSGTHKATTLVCQYALDFSEVEGVTAYVATSATAGNVTFCPVDKVAANTPLYIKADEARGSAFNVNVPEATEGAVDYSETNLLKGSASEAKSLKSDDDTKYYAYGTLNGTSGFYPVSSSSSFTSAAGKAYLALSGDQIPTATGRLMLSFEEVEVTAVQSVKPQVTKDNGWYTLQGVRVSVPSKGIYIRNGKKVIVK